MKLRTLLSLPLCTLATLCAAPLVLAVTQQHPLGDGPADKSLAPQFQVIGGDSNHEVLPLKSTDVKAAISGVIADVTVEQVYQNTGGTPIEALYVFPASTRAAVHGVEMRIGSRVIKSRIKEKQEARATYEKAKEEKKSATLLEEHRPNVFQMSVANILPGEEVRVLLHYSEKVAVSNRVYEFMFPTVVGPRYTGATPAGGTGAETWAQNPYLAEGSPAAATFALKVEVKAGMPLQSMASPSHPGKVEFQAKDQASLALDSSVEHGNRDFVLQYQLAGQQVASGLLLHQGKDSPEAENFFLLNLQPPARVMPAHVPARDYLFVLDVSGSMSGFPMDTCQFLMKELLQNLGENDTFNVLHFATSNHVLAKEPLPATSGNIQRAFHELSNMRGGGGTELLPALQRAMAMPRRDGVSRTVVILTDGYVTIEKEAFRLVRRELNKANVFTFGIGTSVNRWLIEGLAHAGMGEPYVVLNQKDALSAARRFKEYVSAPVLTQVEVRYEGFAAKDLQPVNVPDVFADRPIEIMGKWQGEAQGRIILKGKSGGAPYEASFDVAKVAANGMNNPALRPLWAKDRIQMLNLEVLAGGDSVSGGGSRAEAVQEITALGIQHELLTPYTSFVGVDESPKEVLASALPVTQPLPLPQGVSGQAAGGQPQVVVTSSKTTGGTPGAVPEPGVTGLLLLAAASLLMHRRK
ncbi:MAG: VIT domain-containing protein [Verrucomicrobium sp.]|nr:VIT and VWA domain-containing protein [Verrucomicrobium sp.]